MGWLGVLGREVRQEEQGQSEGGEHDGWMARDGGSEPGANE